MATRTRGKAMPEGQKEYGTEHDEHKPRYLTTLGCSSVSLLLSRKGIGRGSTDTQPAYARRRDSTPDSVVDRSGRHEVRQRPMTLYRTDAFQHGTGQVTSRRSPAHQEVSRFRTASGGAVANERHRNEKDKN